MNPTPVAQLRPRRPTGRCDRKAGAYAAQIQNLRAAGFTYEAIREALSDVGVEVTESSLRREVRRPSTGQPPAARVPSPHPAPLAAMQPANATPLRSPTLASDHLHLLPASASTGRQVAEAFFNAHPSNPLLAVQGTP